MKRKLFFLFISLSGIFCYFLIFRQIFDVIVEIAGLSRFNASEHIEKLLLQSPTLRDRLLLIDKNILREVQIAKGRLESYCILCSIQRHELISFGLITPVNRSLEELVLLPILKAWESGFWLEQIVNSNYNSFSPIRVNLPLGFILQKSGVMFIELVLLHQREGDFWWHGSIQQDTGFVKKLANVKLSEREASLLMHLQGAYDKIRFETITIDGQDFNVPRNIDRFLASPSTFIECNFQRAHQFHQTYGKDSSVGANLFRHRVAKLLSTTKAVLDNLNIPFWISSGTLLGYYRQCDTIPYSQDVDIGIFIKDYNASIILALVARGFRLKHKFGRVDDGLELSFTSKSLKLDIFFFYEENRHVWNGGHAIVYDSKGEISSGIKYRYRFPKFTLCWTEFLEMKLCVPCETESYILANYGPDWFKPVAKWHWYKDPFNVEEAGVWSPADVADTMQVF